MQKTVRILSLDIARGIFILLMLLGHSIFFFHTGSSRILNLVNGAADMFAFVGLLVISGAAAYVSYVHDNHPTHKLSKRILRRITIYYVGYVLLATLGSLIYEPFSIQSVVQIALFAKLVPFTEFIIPFLVMGVSIIPLRTLYHKIANSEGALLAAVGISIVLYTLGTQWLAPLLPEQYAALLFGARGYFSFPIVSYLQVYLLGLYLGKELYNHEPKKRIVHELTLGSLLFAIVALVFALWWPDISQSISRFPPTPGFVALSLAGVLLVLRVVLSFRNLVHTPVTRTALLLFGQNTFALLFTHTSIAYIYTLLTLPQFSSIILTVILTFLSIYIALYLAKILPLNYQVGLTLINICDCELHHCSHAKEHRYIVRLKRILFAIVSPERILSIKQGKQTRRLVKGWAPLLAAGALLLVATPLGFAENNALLRDQLLSVSGHTNKTWILTSDTELPIHYWISLPDNILDTSAEVTYKISTGQEGVMVSKNGNWHAEILIDKVPIGTHTITTYVHKLGTIYSTQPTVINISHPLFIAWTIDWEGYDVKNMYLEAMNTVSQAYKVPMTHLFNPRIYTSPDISKERAEELTLWVRNRNMYNHEEIGLHLHMFPDYVTSSGITPKSSPVWGGGFTPGYDVLTTAYSEDEMTKIIGKAVKDFEEHDLGVPKSYRAGAWFADTSTIQALENNNFTVDTSGRSAYQFGTNDVDGPWDLSESAQPYFPSTRNQNSPNPPPRFSVLEIPNNGADTYWYKADDMIERFDNIYTNQPLTQPKQITYLSHPHWFDTNKQDTINRVFDHAYKHAYSQDLGPVVFVDLQTIYKAWTEQN